MENIQDAMCEIELLRNIENLLTSIKQPIDLDHLSYICQKFRIQGHLAILSGNYLKKIIEGEKIIESRFSKNRYPPYGVIKEGDIIFLKQSSQEIKALCLAKKISFYGPLRRGQAKNIMLSNIVELCVKKEFIELKKDSKFATLIWLGNIKEINPLIINKHDRRAWIVFNYINFDENSGIQLQLI